MDILVEEQGDIWSQAGLSRTHYQRVLRQEVSVSRRSAEDLEAVTGIGREAWMWPTRWANPYIDASDPTGPRAEDLGGVKRQDWPHHHKQTGLMSQNDVAKFARRSPIALNYIIKGARPAGKAMAESLEDATGIGREAWVWPDRWFCPYIDGSSPLLPPAEYFVKKKGA